MSGLDEAIAGLGSGGAMLAAVLLGLRHATDPDHLTAVSSLVMTHGPDHARRASLLGLCWGLGHATTLLAVGLPLVLLERDLPAEIGQAAELAVGLVIAALAARLLVRWRRGRSDADARKVGRAPRESYGVGLVHGVGGSAGIGILLVGGVSGGAAAALALLLFASASALSMALASGGFGYALTLRPASRLVERLVPMLATLSLVFGAWYAASAL